MKKMYSVKEVREMTGLTRKELYDLKDLVKYETKNEINRYKESNNKRYSGYKQFPEESLDKLIAAGFLKDLGSDNTEIKKILNDDNVNESEIYTKIIDDTRKKIDYLQNVLTIVEEIKDSGISIMKPMQNSFNVLNLCGDINNKEQTKESRENKIARWADKMRKAENSESVKRVIKALDEFNEEKQKKLNKYIIKFSKCLSKPVNDVNVIKLTQSYINFMKENLNADDFYIICLAGNYQGSGEIAKAIDATTVKGTALYIANCITYTYQKLIEDELQIVINKSDEYKGEIDEVYLKNMFIEACDIYKKYVGDFFTNEEIIQIIQMAMISDKEDKELIEFMSDLIELIKEEL